MRERREEGDAGEGRRLAALSWSAGSVPFSLNDCCLSDRLSFQEPHPVTVLSC